MITPVCLFAAFALGNTLLAEPTGPLARWDFDEGSGQLARDGAGGHDGAIHGATWVRSGDGFALRFDGVDDYVLCREADTLDVDGPFTLMAWVSPDSPPQKEPGVVGKFFETYALTLYHGSYYFYVSGGGNNAYAPAEFGNWSHLAGVFDGETMSVYLNGEKVASKVSAEKRVRRGGAFLMGCVIGDETRTDEALRSTSYFAGCIDEVRLYARALPPMEIAAEYNRSAAGKGRKPFDLERFVAVGLRVFCYPQRRELVARIDAGLIAAKTGAARVRAELLRALDNKVAHAVEIDTLPESGIVEATFDLRGLAMKGLRVRAAMIDGTGKRVGERASDVEWPTESPEIPDPSSYRVAMLPRPVLPPSYRIEVTPSGGVRVHVGERAFPIESSFSYPRGGANELLVSGSGGTAESDWHVSVRKLSERHYELIGQGRFYRLRREIRAEQTRVEIEDHFTNLTEDVIGIRLSHHLDLRKASGLTPKLQPNATVFVAGEDSGLGMIPLDDLFYVQHHNGLFDSMVAIRDDHFGLDAGAEYALKWAAYPTSTGDYYDFINQVRQDTGINGRAEGSVELTSRWGPPPRENVDLKALKYVSICYLSHALQNPHNSLEGWEFLEYPDLCDRIRKAAADTRRQFPRLDPMFHVAHSLYICSHPKERFPDSVVIDADGNPIHYGPNTIDYYGNYVAAELFNEGWRWWLFYPTMENSFGKLMLKGADYMIKDLGCTAIWADGYVSGYVREGYTYDFWDGHSVTIDPETKLVTRRKASVTLTALPVLKAVARKFSDASGVLIINDKPAPFSLLKENIITCNETGGGDQQPIAGLHLGRTVTPLGNQTFIRSEEDVYTDILAKLDLGALYFWYGEQEFVKRRTLVSYMYPITFESIHAGIVHGKERIVTNRPGVFGWEGDQQLHAVHHFDGRGMEVPSHFISTVDEQGVRTELELDDRESAAIERIPIELAMENAVNILVTRYDVDAIKLNANGSGKGALSIQDGPFRIVPGKSYTVRIGGQSSEIPADEKGLRAPFELSGSVVVHIARR